MQIVLYRDVSASMIRRRWILAEHLLWSRFALMWRRVGQRVLRDRW